MYELCTNSHDENVQMYELCTNSQDENVQMYELCTNSHGENVQMYELCTNSHDENVQMYELCTNSHDENVQFYELCTNCVRRHTPPRTASKYIGRAGYALCTNPTNEKARRARAASQMCAHQAGHASGSLCGLCADTSGEPCACNNFARIESEFVVDKLLEVGRTALYTLPTETDGQTDGRATRQRTSGKVCLTSRARLASHTALVFHRVTKSNPYVNRGAATETHTACAARADPGRTKLIFQAGLASNFGQQMCNVSQKPPIPLATQTSPWSETQRATSLL
jgi:hypothetical protein